MHYVASKSRWRIRNIITPAEAIEKQNYIEETVEQFNEDEFIEYFRSDLIFITAKYESSKLDTTVRSNTK